ERSLVFDVDLIGTVQGITTDPFGADACQTQSPIGLPYARVEVGDEVVFADAAGDFFVPDLPDGPVSVSSSIRGPYFQVVNQAGVDSVVTHQVVPPGPITLLHNPTDQFEFERAQVNAYVHANLVRDFVLSVNPDYPTIAGQADFTVNVNINDDCNAFYDSSAQTMNFFSSGAGCANTAFDTVVYHEYGHHLINVGGSGQGEYGEGMADSIAILMSDHPFMGRGWHGDCDGALRDADNDCQYSAESCSSCGSQIHACGRVLSGAIWSLRNELLVSDPTRYRDVLASLTLDSILLHAGTSIDEGITVDFLTLDDDNDTLLDGTPHYAEIARAFGAHGMPAPDLDVVGFEFSRQPPEIIDPRGTAIVIGLDDPNDLRVAGTERLHWRVGGGAAPFEMTPLRSVGDGLYEVPFPAVPCGETVEYYLAVDTALGIESTWPTGAPMQVAEAVSASSSIPLFEDDFEADRGWTIDDDEMLTAGSWERGVPGGDGDRGDPLFDGDGSGACFLTGNASGDSDVDNGSTRLVSPALDAAIGEHGRLSYQRWFSNSAGGAPGEDAFVVEVSSDGGGSWIELERVGPTGAETGGGWFQRQWRLDEHVDVTGAIRVRFVATDANPPSIIEAAVDGVRLLVFQCAQTSCPADIDGDGTVAVDDLLTVILAWNDPGGPADLDGNGVVDVDDLLAILLAWGPCST
ncbi:MAG: hypothetical protein ACYTGC_06575, partial [Planctomycetota bacterium]